MENPGSSRSRLWLQLINWHAILHLSDDNLDFLFREGWSSRIREGQLANGGILLSLHPRFVVTEQAHTI